MMKFMVVIATFLLCGDGCWCGVAWLCCWGFAEDCTRAQALSEVLELR